MKEITAYLKEVEKKYKNGDATEHTYRPALQDLLESLDDKLNAVNEPRRIKCGAPDFIITKNDIPLGHIEAKDIGISLDDIEKDARSKKPKSHNGNQLKRYLDELHNLILTNYLEFRWFENGEKRMTVGLGEFDNKRKLKKNPEGIEELNELFNQFLNSKIPTVGNPRDLAKRMAVKTRLIRRLIDEALKDEDKGGSLHSQLEGFREVLIHDLKPEEFADMYAQTISYGLFAARCNYSSKPTFTRFVASQVLPKTNPFLRKMFQYIGMDLDERISWAVDDLAELLDKADITGILKDFGKRTKQEDPVVHFYETFLSEYDPKMREARGVYYTPEPVVSYIVRSIDHILKTDFGIKDGLADKTKIKVKRKVIDENGNEIEKTEEVHKVIILDPAVGTGTFLHGVIDHIYDHIVSSGQKGTWSEYVSNHLLPRLFGFELLMAPYSVAHMKLGLQLQELGYDFKADERLNIFLTNTLEEAFDESGKLPFANFIAQEANQASKVKQELPVMVILGNPPYSGHSANKGKWINDLLRGKDNLTGEKTANYFEVDGKPLGERNPKWLNDDYVKFIRFAQWRIEKTGHGILGFISNHSYLDNPTFRGMRQSLLECFDKIYILDLHGNSKKNEKCPDGSKDENVFDIQQGVAVGVFIKNKDQTSRAIKHSDFWGKREKYLDKNGIDILVGGKYFELFNNSVAQSDMVNLSATYPNYFFIPVTNAQETEYKSGWPTDLIFLTQSIGIATARDAFCIDMCPNSILNRVKEFAKLDVEEARTKYKLGADKRDWQVALAQKDIIQSKLKETLISSISYRPFDNRFTYYTGKTRGLICMPRPEVMFNLFKRDNKAVCFLRRSRESIAGNFFVARHLIDKTVISSADNAYVSPLYLYPKPEKGDLFEDEPTDAPGGRRPNLAPEFIKEFSEKLKMEFIPDGKGDRRKTFGPEDIFSYMYAVFHSPTYRTRYAEFLKIDFPRLPLTSNPVLFRELCAPGDELVALHLMDKTGPRITGYPVDGDHEVDKIRYSEPKKSEKSGKVWINKEQYFEGVPSEVWEFMIGGYQVCQKWLKDRKGRKLTIEDIEHYQNIVSALSETIRLMSEIDAVINKHGGWPIK